MMVMFYAQRVIMEKADFTVEDKTNSKFIPVSMRQKVADTLLESGLDFLVPIQYGGAATETVQ